uniref:Uncharacterized protein n=1 Tax=Arundo donax TaxID=35708 RepID=A0A0A9EBV1_ARUDO
MLTRQNGKEKDNMPAGNNQVTWYKVYLAC